MSMFMNKGAHFKAKESFTLTTLVNLLSWPSHRLMWSESAWETEEGLLWSDPEPELTTTIVPTLQSNTTFQALSIIIHTLYWHCTVTDDITRSLIFLKYKLEIDSTIFHSFICSIYLFSLYYPKQTDWTAVNLVNRSSWKKKPCIWIGCFALHVRQQYFFKVSVKTFLFQKWAFSAFFSPRMVIQKTDTQDQG